MTTITRISDPERERMRRSLASAPQGPTEEQQDFATYPVVGLFRRTLGPQQDPTDVSFPFLRRMRKDHMVAMGLHFIDMGILGAPWFYAGDDARVQSFADHLIRPIYGDLVLSILRFLWSGFSPAARNYDYVNPDWTYYEGGQAKKVWDNGVVDVPIYKSITPLRPESARPSYKGGNFNGIMYDNRYGTAGAFIIDGNSTPSIDVMHSIWAVHDKIGQDGSPYGFPRIAHAAPIFHMFRYIWDLHGRAFENMADPGPIVRYPQDETPALDGDGKIVSNVKTAIKLGTRRRSGSTIALPSDVYKDYTEKPTGVQKWGFEYPKAETNFDSLAAFMGYLEASKLRAIWIPPEGLTEGSGAQTSRNVASEFGDQRDASQRVLMKTIDDMIDEVMVRPIISIVFPFYTGRLEKKTIGMGDDENDLLRQAFQLAGQQNFSQFGIDMRRLAEVSGFPMLDPAEQARLLKEQAAKAQQSQPPAVAPTQGRRALVTQTGFNEFSYHQLGDEVALVDVALEATPDGDFVASLPSTDVFADEAIVKQARMLRAASQAFLAWAYRDFATYVGKTTKLSEDDEDGLDLLEGDGAGVKKAVGKVLRGWRPDQQRVDAYAKAVRTRLSRVFDRVAAAHGTRLGASARASSIDQLAASWLEERAAESVTRIMTTTREQVALVLADGVRAGKDQRQVAADLRSHFDEFPLSRAETIARTEVGEAYNFATVEAGTAAGVTHAQLVDGEGDRPCADRNGQIVTLATAAKQRLAHPNCTLFVRLLPRAPASLEVRHEVLADGVQARYDAESETVLISTETSSEDETKYMLELGAVLALAPADT